MSPDTLLAALLKSGDAKLASELERGLFGIGPHQGAAAFDALHFLESPVLTTVKVEVGLLEFGEKLGSGSHSNAYFLKYDPTKVIVILKYRDRHDHFHFVKDPVAKLDPENSAFFVSQIEATRAANAVWYRGHTISPKVFAEVLENGECIGYVAERLPGRDFATLVKSGQLNLDQSENVFIQLKEQLDLLHSHGLVHGDVNPGNVMVDPESLNARFIDFEPSNGSWTPQDDLYLFDRLKEKIYFAIRKAKGI
jgi:serine/threonine protein kinase